MSKQMVSNPVARSTDPITSDLAGENEDAKASARKWVRVILSRSPRPLSHWEIFQAYQRLPIVSRVRAQRLRTACKELRDMGEVVHAGMRDRASETGLKAAVWELKPEYRVGPRGESQPVTDHSTDPLVPEVAR